MTLTEAEYTTKRETLLSAKQGVRLELDRASLRATTEPEAYTEVTRLRKEMADLDESLGTLEGAYRESERELARRADASLRQKRAAAVDRYASHAQEALNALVEVEAGMAQIAAHLPTVWAELDRARAAVLPLMVREKPQRRMEFVDYRLAYVDGIREQIRGLFPLKSGAATRPFDFVADTEARLAAFQALACRVLEVEVMEPETSDAAADGVPA